MRDWHGNEFVDLGGQELLSVDDNILIFLLILPPAAGWCYVKWSGLSSPAEAPNGAAANEKKKIAAASHLANYASIMSSRVLIIRSPEI